MRSDSESREREGEKEWEIKIERVGDKEKEIEREAQECIFKEGTSGFYYIFFQTRVEKTLKLERDKKPISRASKILSVKFN